MSRRVDMNNIPAFDKLPAGPVASLKKPELCSLAKELGIDLPLDSGSITVNTLKGQITAAIGKNPNDTRFHKFVVHRAQTTGGAALKNSADKDKEDMEAKSVHATGAHRKLLEKRVKSDPAPQLKRLNKTALKLDVKKNGDKDKAPNSPGTLSPLSPSENESVPSDPGELEEVLPPPPKPLPSPGPSLVDSYYYRMLKQHDAEAQLPVAVEFCGEKVTQLVWIPPAVRAAIPLFRDVDGGVVASLKQLIPAALTQLSPNKENPHRRLTLIQGQVAMSLGSAEQFMKGNFPDTLEVPAADMCPLQCLPDRLILSLLWKKGEHPKKAPETESDSASDSEPHFAGSFKPLEAARERSERKKSKKSQKQKKIDDDDDDDSDRDREIDSNTVFLACVRDTIGVKIEKKKPGGLSTIGPRLARWNQRQQCIEYCDENFSTGRAKGKPYRMPEELKDHEKAEYREFANRAFSKKTITNALGIVNGTLTADGKLFESPDLEFDTKAKMWVDGDVSLDDKIKAKFDKMSATQWKEHLTKAREAHEAAEAASRKRRRSSSSSAARASAESSSEDDEQKKLERRLAEIKSEKKEQRATKKARNGEGSRKSKASTRFRSNSLDH
ncbi:hypothetical protein R3P38DRAFT_2754619 [Favolaschia claudopus]|uniref:Uncharacterized protein n=1 Tax=Favolaschia claudopus TaxID=2862362 RepID=A0AAV9YZX6_9AGAR